MDPNLTKRLRNLRIMGSLNCPTITMYVDVVKECVFNPPVFLTTKRLWFVAVVNSEHMKPPPAGWYDVPEKGHITWIRYFRLEAASLPNSLRSRCFIWEAFEGDPPMDILPKRSNIPGTGVLF